MNEENVFSAWNFRYKMTKGENDYYFKNYMLMKTKKCLFLVAMFATTVLTSCNSNKVREKMLPEISGAAGEVVLIIEDEVWKSSVDTLLNVLCEDVPGLPQSEPMFDLVHIPNSAFSEIFQRHRNIIDCNIVADSVSGIKVAYDIWAKPQTIVKITAPSVQEFVNLILDNRDKLVGIILKAEQDRIIKNYSAFPDREVQARLEKSCGINMTIPKGYTYDMDTNNFVWISHETPEISQGIFVYYYDYTDTLAFTRDRLIATRNQMCKNYVGGPRDGSYMTTVMYEDVTTFRSYSLHGKYTAELRGLWETKGDFMGGPFVSISQYDEKRNRIVTVDGYVYAGKKDKRNYMRQVEAIMQTINFVE